MKINKKSLSGLMGLAALGLFSSTANAFRQCDCECYDLATNLYPQQRYVITSGECSSLNGNACIWDAGGGETIPGTLDNCHS